MNKLQRELAALLLVAGLSGTTNAVTLEAGLSGNLQKVSPVVGISQAFFKKGKVGVSGRVEKQFGIDMALQAWGTYTDFDEDSVCGRYSTVSFKEGIDKNSNPFNPGYTMPGFETGIIVNNSKKTSLSFGAGGRVYFPKGKEYDIQATLTAGYKWGNFGVKFGPAIPIINPGRTTAKLTFTCDVK